MRAADNDNVVLVENHAPQDWKEKWFISNSIRKSCFEIGSNCFLVKTVDLLPFRGNPATPLKYDPLEESLLNEPLHELPVLSVNCVTGMCKLIEGNNRHEVFYKLHRTWFPVRVLVEQDYGCDTSTKIPAQWKCDTNWKTVVLWRENLAIVLYKVFGINSHPR